MRFKSHRRSGDYGVDSEVVANTEHYQRLKRGVDNWNDWRKTNTSIRPDLSLADLSHENLIGVDLSGATLEGVKLIGAKLNSANFSRSNLGKADLSQGTLNYADLSRANLREANLLEANLIETDLTGADFSKAKLGGAVLIGARFTDCELREANLGGARLQATDISRGNLERANLSWAQLIDVELADANLEGTRLLGAHIHGANLTKSNLRDADLTMATLVRINLKAADLSGCRAYGVSAWDLNLEGAIQQNIIITPEDQAAIQVDQLEVAQLVYLLLNNTKIRYFIDTITSKVVLILGRFTEERKAVLEALRTALRDRDYLPVLFDWDKPANRDITETVSTLAHMAKFVIADITDAKSIPQELMTIVPSLPSVPVQPLLCAPQREYGMFEHFKNYPWVLPIAIYERQDELLRTLQNKVIEPAESKLNELKRKSMGPSRDG